MSSLNFTFWKFLEHSALYENQLFVYLLATRELEFGPPESLNDRLLMLVIGPDRHQGLTNVDTGNKSLGFAKSTSHSSLEPEIIEKILWNQLFQNYMVLRVLCRVVHNLELTFYVKWAENFWNHHTPCLVYNQSVGVSEIFLRFYVKLVTLILEPKNCFFQHFSRSEYRLFGTFCHFQVKNVSKYWNSKLYKLLW